MNNIDNVPQQEPSVPTQNQTPVKNQPDSTVSNIKQRVSFPLILGVVMIMAVLAGGAVYLGITKNKTPTSYDTPPPISSPTLKPTLSPKPTGQPTSDESTSEVLWKVEATKPSIISFTGHGTPEELQQAISGENGIFASAPISLTLKGNVTKDENLLLTIWSNPSTGASWQIKDIDTSLIKANGETYFTGGSGLSGSSQNQIIPLKAVSTGKAVITLIYNRSWEKEQPVRYVTLESTQLRSILYLISLGVTQNKTPTITESYCAKAGEETVSNFDMTTGKINPNIKIKNCCSGLKSLDQKQLEIHRNPDVCAMNTGVNTGICSPCGNGVCDSQYEDYCNCPEDCGFNCDSGKYLKQCKNGPCCCPIGAICD